MARLGIYVSQRALDVTGNNITNINNQKYTRQVLDQSSLYVGGADRYCSTYDIRIGSGAIATGTSQLRDQYLDIRYRNENASVGYMDAKLAGLNEIATRMDEVFRGGSEDGERGEGVIEAQFNKLIAQLEDLHSDGAGKDEFDTLVRSETDALVSLFHNYANELDTLYDNQQMGLEQDVKTVNTILTQIRDLNRSIRKSEIHGADALEQKDERNYLIDQLSNYMRVSVIYSDEDLGDGFKVEKLTIKLAGNDPGDDNNQAYLIDGFYGTQLKLDATKGGNFDITLDDLKDVDGRIDPDPNVANVAQPLGDHTLYGALQAEREMLTEQGEYATNAQLAQDPDAKNKRGIPFYRKTLDTLANKLAAVMNEANRGVRTAANLSQYPVYPDDVFDIGGGKLVKLPTEIGTDGQEHYKIDKTICTLSPDETLVQRPMTDLQKTHLLPAALGGSNHCDGYVDVDPAQVESLTKAGNLISNSSDGDDCTGITAANISVSHGWSSGTTRIVRSRQPGAGSTANDNLAHMVVQFQSKQTFNPTANDLTYPDINSDQPFFNGTFQEFLTNHVAGILATDQKTTSTMLQNYADTADEIYVNRDAVSGVDLNDEAMSMMQYQKSYSAACRLMTTIDEMLDKLINGTGRAGL